MAALESTSYFVFEPAVLALRLVLFLLGASIGSFLAATAYRLPRRISLFEPSRCVHCGAKISVLGLVPVLGFLFVRGKCTSCQSPFSWSYAAVEFFAGLMTLYVVECHVGSFELLNTLAVTVQQWSHGFSGFSGETLLLGKLHYAFLGSLVVSLWLLYSGIILSLIDLEFRILPDVITLPGVIFGLGLSTLDPGRGFVSGLMGALAGGGGLWLVAYLYKLVRGRDGMGMGDVKYLALIGACLGPAGVLWCLMIASLVGSFMGIGYALFLQFTGRGHASLQTALPFGPFLAAGALAYSLHEPFFKALLLMGSES